MSQGQLHLGLRSSKLGSIVFLTVRAPTICIEINILANFSHRVLLESSSFAAHHIFCDHLNGNALHQLPAKQLVRGCVMSFLTIKTVAAVAVPLVTRNLQAGGLQKNSFAFLCSMNIILLQHIKMPQVERSGLNGACLMDCIHSVAYLRPLTIKSYRQ